MIGYIKSLLNKNKREIRKLIPIVNRINAFEEEISKLSDEELVSQKEKFKKMLSENKTLEDILPEAFATVREVSRRKIKMRHFDVQLIGGIVLHRGKISEMRTGEGKTLVATLAAYLNALEDKGVHIVTVNDYLAKRDSEWMRPLYEGLGMRVGTILNQGSLEDKIVAYSADVTYGTNNEFGFDYLRDHMAVNKKNIVQRELNYAIIDEVDSILIDEARTPLIISGEVEDNVSLYKKFDQLVKKLVKQDFTEVSTIDILEKNDIPEDVGDFMVDEKNNQIQITDKGHGKLEQLLIREGLMSENESLYSSSSIHLLHHANIALKANHLFFKDVHYLIRNGQVIIVDESTGRAMQGRRWSDGLHQAVEAKEKVNIQNESQTLASTSFQNYFRLYKKLSGMTGTADTEATELNEIYKMDVIVIPTNKPVRRKDLNDLIYMTQEEKYEAIIEEIKYCRQQEQPVLIGTASVEASELLSELLRKNNIHHNVLNAKQHEREAYIIAEAGRPGAVTIATNMAGRGTDIVLGGNVEMEISSLDEEERTEEKILKLREEAAKRQSKVINAGGLYILGSERHESRRIDNQLRGRSGRQGDPGVSRFFLSMEDSLIRLFASDKVRAMMQRMGIDRGEAIEHRLVNSSIERAQKKVEARNYDIRKGLLEYDDIANEQRKNIYKYREDLLFSDSIEDNVNEVRDSHLIKTLEFYLPEGLTIEQYDLKGLSDELKEVFHIKLDINHIKSINIEEITSTAKEKLKEQVQKLENKIPPDILRQIEKNIMLQILDISWREHLSKIDFLRQGIHFRSYAQKNPKQEYKRESFELFKQMLVRVNRDFCKYLMNLSDDNVKLKIQNNADINNDSSNNEQNSKQENSLENKTEEKNNQKTISVDKLKNIEEPQMNKHFVHNSANQSNDESANSSVKWQSKKVGRNDPCPCGSGKKYKKCHGNV